MCTTVHGWDCVLQCMAGTLGLCTTVHGWDAGTVYHSALGLCTTVHYADNACVLNDTSTSFTHSDLMKSPVPWCSGIRGSESLRLSSDVTEKGRYAHAAEVSYKAWS